MNFNLRINFPGPGEIIRGRNLRKDLSKRLKEIGESVLVMGPQEVFEEYEGYFKVSLSKTKNFICFFNGECSYKEIERIEKIGRKNSVDMVFCFGGGKAIDTGKYVSYLLKKPLIVLQTSSSTCAGYSHHSVIYEENGVFIEEKESKNPEFLFIDYDILIEEPQKLFRAGVADALSKFYELKNVKGPLAELGIEVSKRIYVKTNAIVLNAMRDLLAKRMSEDILDIFDISILYPGIVGYLGGKVLRAGVAHAFSNAITNFIPKYPELKKKLHGEIVGFGILLMLYLKENFDELFSLRRLFKKIRVPVNFKELGIESISVDELKEISKETIKQEIYNLEKDENKFFNALRAIGLS
ncbi:MAG: hypothetical protein DRI22_02305 [Caldiserica bacterium]|nr:MAG: hypothetical protein DRI22_02305 [Caldisericota bacterium]